jgi:hypothetical protein
MKFVVVGFALAFAAHVLPSLQLDPSSTFHITLAIVAVGLTLMVVALTGPK